MSFLLACCSCWRREGEHPSLLAPVPEEELCSLNGGLGLRRPFPAKAGVGLGEDPLTLKPPAAVLEDEFISTSTPPHVRSRPVAHVIHSGTYRSDERGPTEELYDDDWNAWESPSGGAESWQRARRNWQAHRAIDSLREDVWGAQTSELYEVDWSSLPSPHQVVAKWQRARKCIQASKAMDGVLETVRGRQLEHMYDRDWVTEADEGDFVRTEYTSSAGSTPAKVAQDTSEAGSSRGQEHWRKLRLAVDSVGAMEPLLDSARKKQTEEMYEQDWTQATPRLDHKSEADAAKDLCGAGQSTPPAAIATSAAA
mmetsp:Transcript_41926/g.125371  ORF Transcript_41926/g.125371 Transcript_41926/m.125371 type:complete len:311 (+) Transcript_41926:55-987(+)